MPRTAAVALPGAPPPFGFPALGIVLALDALGVAAVVLVAALVADGGTAQLVVVCAVVGAVTWLLAVAAIVCARLRMRPVVATRLIWLGLIGNTIGCLGVVIVASGAGSTPGATPLAGCGVALAAGGAVLSAVYLLLLPRAEEPAGELSGSASAPSSAGRTQDRTPLDGMGCRRLPDSS
jgi:hypothetical protein